MLDLVAALLSGGRATHEIPLEPELETGNSCPKRIPRSKESCTADKKKGRANGVARP